MESTLSLPVVPLKQLTILPGMMSHFDVSRKKGIKALEKAMAEEQLIFAVTQQTAVDSPMKEDLYQVGTVCKIKQLVKMPNGIVRVLVEGLYGAELLELYEEAYLQADICLYAQDTAVLSENMRDAYVRVLKEMLTAYVGVNDAFSKDMAKRLLEISEAEQLIDQIAIQLPMAFEKKQFYLETVSMQEKFEFISETLQNEIAVNTIKKRLQEQVKERVDKNQREYLLREQMRAIQEELGESDPAADADLFQEQLESMKLPEEIHTGIEKEIRRFRNMPVNAAESSILRTYLETVLEMPWNRVSEDNTDLKNARKILEEDHYGLEKVKERVMEFLAVRVLTEAKGDSPIICLVGPPGVGKTSIAKSVARALNKKYVRISLGGVRDEAEIRGHRKTYIGAMPGRIANGLRQTGTKNPLMLFDEIDKMASDYKGDPSSAMLEVLDSEQNTRFRDNYIELPIDLSEVLFIATANDVQTIPKPLLDRMELIEVSSYTINEKVHIAKEHLWKKQLKRHGLKQSQLSITQKALEQLITGYTREAGVRGLERKIGQLCRKAASQIAEKGRVRIRITERNLEQFLGKPVHVPENRKQKDEIGVVTGLAWTSVGGDTLEIEVNVMQGRGEIQMTGKLGDVMKESASTALSYIRSIADIYGIDAAFFRKHDIHIHVPEGAVPKDGPSAGITMATAMLSAVTGIPVKADVAMTGEITLRGRVLPIGGLKEKILAAKMAGIKTVLVPEANRRDVDEISEEIKEGISLVFVSTMRDVVKKAFTETD